MEVVLLENIKNLGNIGDVVNVKRGHGRNFLIRFGKALIASKENIDSVNKKKSKLNEKNIAFKKNAKKIHDVINLKKYTFSKESKDNGDLYGSIKPKEISQSIEKQDNLEIKPSEIDLSKEINKIGSYKVTINLHAEVQALIHIEVVKLEQKN
tara:strand:- start:767 stop:1225 length:459 start_codon:yes stop_codon:yes gene_type:complete